MVLLKNPAKPTHIKLCVLVSLSSFLTEAITVWPSSENFAPCDYLILVQVKKPGLFTQVSHLNIESEEVSVCSPDPRRYETCDGAAAERD